MKFDIDRTLAPGEWIHSILQHARSLPDEPVEQQLVGAALAVRYPAYVIPIHRTQTGATADFELQRTAYHVTRSPSQSVINECISNVQAGFHPVLLVPRDRLAAAEMLAEIAKARKSIFILPIEIFMTHMIIGLANDRNTDFFNVLQDIVKRYNERLAEVETDMSLQIEVR